MAKPLVCLDCQRLSRRLSETLANHFRSSESDAKAAGDAVRAVLKAIENHKLRTGHDLLDARRELHPLHKA